MGFTEGVCKIYETRGPVDLLLGMGQMRMKLWKLINELLDKNKILYHLIFSVQFLPPSQVLAQFLGFIRVYTSPVRPPVHSLKCYVLSSHSYGTRRMNYIESTLYQ